MTRSTGNEAHDSLVQVLLSSDPQTGQLEEHARHLLSCEHLIRNIGKIVQGDRVKLINKLNQVRSPGSRPSSVMAWQSRGH